jgi:hypothetical protein
MYRQILILFCVLVVVLTQAGCFGLIVGYPKEYPIGDPKPFEHISRRTAFALSVQQPERSSGSNILVAERLQ